MEGEMPLGEPLVAQTVFVIKNKPPALPKRSQWSKNKQKIKQKNSPSVKKSSESGPFLDPGPADCAKRLQSLEK